MNMTHDAFTLKAEQLLECFKVYNECINNYNNNNVHLTAACNINYKLIES